MAGSDRFSRTSLDRRRFLKGALAAGAGLALYACAPPTGAPAPGASAGSPVAGGASIPKVNTTTKVAGPHLETILSGAALPVGKAKGFWDEYGLTQEFTGYAGGGDVIRAVTSGANHYAVAAPTAVLAAFVRGEPLRLIGCSFGGLAIKFVVLRDSPIRSIQDLAGKKVGFSTPGSNTHFLSQESLKQAGVQAEIVSVGGSAESITALRTGVVDCTWAAEPVPAMNQDIVRVLWDTNQYVPQFMETVLTTTADYLERNENILRAFIAGFGRSQEFIKGNLREAAGIWAQEVGLGDKSTQIVSAFMDTKPEMWTLRLDPAALEAIERSMRDLNQINQAVNWKELVDQRFLPDNLRVTI